MKFTLSEKQIIAAIIVLITILYFQTAFHHLIFLDDDTLIYEKFDGLNFWEKILFSFSSNYLGGHYYRPITLITFITDSLIAGQSYLIYHFTNFLIHLFTSILIFLSFRKFGYSLLIALFSAALFALNPININAVGWIAGRGDLLAAFFSIAALFIYLKFLKNNKPLLLIFVSSLLFLAFLSKEVSLLVPFLFLMLYFIEKKELSFNKNSISVLLMVVIVFGSYYLLRGIFLSEVYIDKFSFTTYYKNILILPETISKFFIPIGIKALPSIESFTSILGTIIFILLLLLPIKLNTINRFRYYFGFLWFILLLIPGMVFRTMGQDGFYYWDCRSYLPLIGLLFIAAEVFRVIDLQKHNKRFIVLAAIYLIIMGAFTFAKIKMYENPITYWNTVKEDYPTRFLPYVGLYNYYNKSKDLGNAETQLEKAIEINQNDLSLRLILNNFYLINNMNEKAFLLIKDTFAKKVSGSANLVETYITLCIELYHLSELDKIIAQYSGDNIVREKIKEIIIQEAESLKENKDSLKSKLLLEKIQKYNL